MAVCFGDRSLGLARQRSDRGDTQVTYFLPPHTGNESVAPVGLPKSPFRFDDVAGVSGIRFDHHSPLTEERHTHLVYGSGLVYFDRDGWPDLYCCQGATYATGASDVDGSSATSPTNSLYQNRQNGSFVDVTQAAGLFDTRYSMGIAAARAVQSRG